MHFSCFVGTDFKTIQQSGKKSQKTAKKVSDEELNTFASIYKNVNAISQQAQQEMIKKVQNNGFQVKKFQMLQQKKQQGQSLELSDEKKEKFQTTNKAIKKIQQSTQKKAMAAIKNGGMTLQRYQQVIQQLRKDQELQKKLKAKMQPQQKKAQSQE